MDKLLSMLGLAMRAGKVTCGAFMCRQVLTSGRARLVILAHDMSERSKQEFIYKCEKQKTPCIIYGEMSALGKAIGKTEKTVVSVNDENFAQAIVKIYGGGMDGKTKNS